jgi:hypothetical protein
MIIEPVTDQNIQEVAKLYFRRCNYLKFKDPWIIAEYLRRNLHSKNHLQSYLIKKDGVLVGASHMVRVGRNTGLILYTAADESFTGPEMMMAFGRAYRNIVKELIAKQIYRVISAAPKDNEAVKAYSVATGYICYYESDFLFFYETFLPLIASVLSNLSGVKLEKISLLKLAQIAANPLISDGFSYTFDFIFKNQKYIFKIDRMSGGMESISSPNFSLGFQYANGSFWAGDKFSLSFLLSNSSDCPQLFHLKLTAQQDNEDKPLHDGKYEVKPHSHVTCPTIFGPCRPGIIFLKAEVEADGKSIVLSKAFRVYEPVDLQLNLPKLAENCIGFDIKNNTESQQELAVLSTAKGKTSEQRAVIDGKGGGSFDLPPNNGPGETLIQIGLCKAANYKNVSISGHKDTLTFFIDDDCIHANEHFVIRLNKKTGILSSGETLDPCCVVFQIPEELGPPFTEYEFNKFQFIPISDENSPLIHQLYPPVVSEIEFKNDNHGQQGIVMKYELASWPGVYLEKEMSFKENDVIEIRPKLINRSGKDVKSALIIRTCLVSCGDTVIRVPVGSKSGMAANYHENPYHISEMLLKGAQLRESWTSFEFPKSRKCVGLIWRDRKKKTKNRKPEAHKVRFGIVRFRVHLDHLSGFIEEPYCAGQ